MIFNKDIMLTHLDDFKKIYDERPIKINNGGMKSPHMFPTYFYLKTRQPKLIIESGVWMGQGTWLMEKICPSAKIISIDLNLNKLVYKSNKVTYLDKDLTTMDLSLIDGYDKDDILIFLDDHQNFTDRIDFFMDNGFKHIIYEDNYPFEQGDCISPKKIFNGCNFIIDIAGNRRESFITEDVRNKVINSIEYYEEAPPLFDNNKNRWGLDWQKYDTISPILSEEDVDEHNLFYEERLDYTWISYLKLKQKV